MKNNDEFIKPKKLNYKDFPKALDEPAGMETLYPNLKSVYPDIKLNVVYTKKSNKLLHLHIITPAIDGDNKNAYFPLIMWIQGSAFQKQNLELHLAQMIDVAKHGYVVAMVEYRGAPESPFPAQIKDLKTATRFMLAHAFKYHIDTEKYVAWGESSGAHTAVLGAATQNIQKYNDEDVSVMPLHFKGVIDFYGPTDISYMNKARSTQNHVESDSPEGKFFDEQNIYDIPELVQAANPINYINDNKDLPPILIMHGNKDRLVPFNQSVLLYQALKKANKTVSFYRLNNSDHASDGFFDKKVLDVVYQFLDNCFK